ncbi:hypothetical protein GWI33_005681 [Rhynchophorus ferrugineus]|uniref:Annexin n=1 Tax=Rhynchophorus ferrugineus TaxID=354439 RepID=A0A834IYT8_RHYFE|nr:hypothetical protein GWI33_005681 [Rhynchophorus ferrugineus]
MFRFICALFIITITLHESVCDDCLRNATRRVSRTPTVFPYHPLNVTDDAAALRQAMYGLGTDEDALINVLAHRTKAQRLKIAERFKEDYGKDLLKDLKSETSGNFQKLLEAMMLPPAEYLAYELNKAMDGSNTDEDVLIGILCTQANHEIIAIRRAYQTAFQRNLEDDLVTRTSDTAQRLVITLCNACPDDQVYSDVNEAKKDAEALVRVGVLNLGVDQSALNNILYQRNWKQLQLIFEEYKKLTGYNIETVIKNEFAITRSIKNQSAFFARLFRKSTKGLGTNDASLIRLVVTRSERDMVEIKQEFEEKYGETLADAIKADTSGYYEKCLLALIGEE